MKKKALFAVTAAVALMTSCSQAKQEQSEVSVKEENNSSSDVQEKKGSEIKAISSSPTSPLKTKEWGSAAKFSVSEQKYYNVPVRIVGVEYGLSADKTVKMALENKKGVQQYSAAKDGEQWVVAEYEMNLDGFPVDERGADPAVSSFVISGESDYITFNGKKFSPVTVSLTDDEFYFMGTVKGKVAFILPEKCSDYILALGEYGETQAFFSF